jgi:diketogulonate reductase-like aldo/keto reductase
MKELLTTVSGNQLHPIGIGTWPMGSQQNEQTREITANYEHDERDVAAITYSLQQGQNHIDTAELYGAGHTEELVGQALAQPDIVREDVFVTTKLWKEGVAPENVLPRVEAMLSRLNTDWIDLLYVHTTKYGTPWEEGLPVMDRLISEGLVRHIGASEFDLPQLRRAEQLVSHGVAALQLKYNVGDSSALSAPLRRHCETRGTAVVAYSPLGKGEALTDPRVQAVAERHDATPAQIALAWCIANNTLPIPMAIDRRHIDDNLGASAVNLSLHDRIQLAS